MSDMVINQNSSHRITSKLRVYYGTKEQTLLTGFSVDLSTGGLYIQTEQPLKENDSLELRFSLPEYDRSVSCRARVAWVNQKDSPRKPELPPGVGVQFLDLSLDAMQVIRRFLEHNEIEPTW